jgi:hypothetical protein
MKKMKKMMKKKKGIVVLFVLALLLAFFMLPSIASAAVICKWSHTSGVGFVEISEQYKSGSFVVAGITKGEGLYIESQHTYGDKITNSMSASNWAHLESKEGNFSHGTTGKNYLIGAVACESYAAQYLDKGTNYAMTRNSFSMNTNSHVIGKAHIGFAAGDGGSGGGSGSASIYGTEDYIGNFQINNDIRFGFGGDWLGSP